MKIASDKYFELAIPGLILLAFGMSVIKTTVFNVDFSKVNASSLVNQRLLKNVTVLG